jgi:hypothetical protein
MRKIKYSKAKEIISEKLNINNNEWIVQDIDVKLCGLNFSAVYVYKNIRSNSLKLHFNRKSDNILNKFVGNYATFFENKNNINLFGFKVTNNFKNLHSKISRNKTSIQITVTKSMQKDLLSKKVGKIFKLQQNKDMFYFDLSQPVN